MSKNSPIEYNLDLFVHLGCLKNIDLSSQGIYSIRVKVVTPNGASASSSDAYNLNHPIGLFSAPRSLNSYIDHEKGTFSIDRVELQFEGSHAHVEDGSSAFRSRGIVLRYTSEEIDLNEGAQWRLPLQDPCSTPITSSNGNRTLFAHQRIWVVFELLYADVKDNHTYTDDSLSVIASESLLIQNAGTGLHEYYPVRFYRSTFVGMDVMIHTCISSFNGLKNLKLGRNVRFHIVEEAMTDLTLDAAPEGKEEKSGDDEEKFTKQSDDFRPPNNEEKLATAEAKAYEENDTHISLPRESKIDPQARIANWRAYFKQYVDIMLDNRRSLYQESQEILNLYKGVNTGSKASSAIVDGDMTIFESDGKIPSNETERDICSPAEFEKLLSATRNVEKQINLDLAQRINHMKSVMPWVLRPLTIILRAKYTLRIRSFWKGNTIVHHTPCHNVGPNEIGGSMDVRAGIGSSIDDNITSGAELISSHPDDEMADRVLRTLMQDEFNGFCKHAHDFSPVSGRLEEGSRRFGIFGSWLELEPRSLLMRGLRISVPHRHWRITSLPSFVAQLYKGTASTATTAQRSDENIFTPAKRRESEHGERTSIGVRGGMLLELDGSEDPSCSIATAMAAAAASTGPSGGNGGAGTNRKDLFLKNEVAVLKAEAETVTFREGRGAVIDPPIDHQHVFTFLKKEVSSIWKSNKDLLARGERLNNDLHIVVLHHGFLGHTYDMRLLRNILVAEFPFMRIYVPDVNEGKTEESIVAQGERLAEYIYTNISDDYPELFQGPCTSDGRHARISFVGHSLGGLVVRRALEDDRLEPLLRLAQNYISLASPHLGSLYAPSQLVSTGMWALQRLKGSQVLKELSLVDSLKGSGEAVLQTMSRSGVLARFQKVVLVSSSEDLYVPTYSARIQRYEGPSGSSRTPERSSFLSSFRSPSNPDSSSRRSGRGSKAQHAELIIENMATDLLRDVRPESLVRVSMTNVDGAEVEAQSSFSSPSLAKHNGSETDDDSRKATDVLLEQESIVVASFTEKLTGKERSKSIIAQAKQLGGAKKKSLSGYVDSYIGRSAHISYLESQMLVEQLVYTLYVYFV
jgi:hypothetical protein